MVLNTVSDLFIKDLNRNLISNSYPCPIKHLHLDIQEV